MTSERRGRSTSAIEVTNVSIHGFWLLLQGREIFVPFDAFPWFRDASIGQLVDVELQTAQHLYWRQLDIDLAVESLDHPDRYPLISRVQADKRVKHSGAVHEGAPRYAGKRGSRRASTAKR
jgi:hypothetical protein